MGNKEYATTAGQVAAGAFPRVYNPEIEDAYDESPYSMCDNNMVNRTDPDGRFWNYVVGAVAGAAVEYGSQVAANFVEGKGMSSFTENIDVADIGVSALEGAVTSGGSAVRSLVAKTAITVGAEVVRNTFDAKASKEGVKTSVNGATNVVKNTVIGLTVGAITTKAKVNLASSTTANKAVQGARAAAHSEGKRLTTIEAKATAAKARTKNALAKNVNKTVSDNVNKAAGGTASEVIKRKTDDERK